MTLTSRLSHSRGPKGAGEAFYFQILRDRALTLPQVNGRNPNRRVRSPKEFPLQMVLGFCGFHVNLCREQVGYQCMQIEFEEPPILYWLGRNGVWRYEAACTFERAQLHISKKHLRNMMTGNRPKPLQWHQFLCLFCLVSVTGSLL